MSECCAPCARDYARQLIAARMSGLSGGAAIVAHTARVNEWKKIKAAGMPAKKDIPWDIKTPMDFLRAAVERSDWKSVGDWYAFSINNILKSSTDPAKFWTLCTLDLGSFRKLAPFTMQDLFAFVVYCDIPYAINDLGREVGLGTSISPNDDHNFGEWLLGLSGSDGAISITQAIRNINERTGRGMALGWVKEPRKHTVSRIMVMVGTAIVGGAAVSAALTAGAGALTSAVPALTTGAGQVAVQGATQLIKERAMDALQSAVASTNKPGAPRTADQSVYAQIQSEQTPMSAFAPTNLIRAAVSTAVPSASSDYASIMGKVAGRDIGIDRLKKEVQSALNAGMFPGAKPNFSIDGALFGGCKGCKGATLDDIVRTAVAGGELDPLKILDVWTQAVNRTWGVKWFVPSNATTRQIIVDLIDAFISKYNPNAPYTYGAPVQAAPPPTAIVTAPAAPAPTVPSNIPIKMDPSLYPSQSAVQPLPAVVPVDRTGELIQAMLAQGASQQQAFAAALQSLAVQGVQTTPQVQAQVAEDVKTATAGTGDNKSLWIAGGLAVLAVLFATARPGRRHA